MENAEAKVRSMLLDMPPPPPCTRLDVRQLRRGRCCKTKSKVITIPRRTCLEVYRDVLTCAFLLMAIIGLVLCSFHAKLTFDVTRKWVEEHESGHSFLYRNTKGDIYRVHMQSVAQEEALMSGEKIYDSYRFVPVTTPKTTPKDAPDAPKVDDIAAPTNNDQQKQSLSSSSSSEETQSDASFSSTVGSDPILSPEDKISTTPRPTFEAVNAEANEIPVKF